MGGVQTMKVMVTGGAGFIGSNTVDALVEKGHEVVMVDSFLTGKREYLNLEAGFYKMDIRDKGLADVFRDEKIDAVMHLAAQVQVRKSLEDPLFDSTINVTGSINLLECCRKYGVGKVVYSSSGGAIYGEPEYLPADEDHPIKPLSPYGASKYVVELYLGIYNRLYGLDYTILRYGNVYGPRQDPYGEAGVIAIFCQRMLDGKAPVVFGDGTQTRDYVYVKDVVKSNLAALERGTGPEALNIGTGTETSVLELVEIINAHVDTGVTPEFAPPIEGEVNRIYLDISKAKKVLGWQPEVSLEDGIEDFVDYLEDR
jgi:UDP-glucose 4-epimerase